MFWRLLLTDCNLYNLAINNINVRASGPQGLRASGQKGGKERRMRKTQKKATPAYKITNKEQLAFASVGSWRPTGLAQVMQPSTPMPFFSQIRTSSNPTLTVPREATSIGLGLGQAMAQGAAPVPMRSQYRIYSCISRPFKT